ncbi:MAG TPA: serine/threonine-protein kinase [Enhygromyxa sp.]|nr:serine/threonine-protein kinase [Enhygromyxa sp.]
MATCLSCGAMIERAATECWHCGTAVLASAQVVGDDSAGGAPTVPFGDTHTWTRSQRTMIGREVIGQYVIVDKLGEGGMGEVYLADQPAIGRQVAIKIVHPQTRERDHDEHVERFRNEAKAAASLESPHIVQIFNWGELEDGTLFMAMEYLPGRTLAQLLEERGALEPELAVAVAEQICAALGEAHAAGIVHRDLKPSNIMLIERGEQSNFAKVLDFGVAKLEGSDITRSGAMFGTPQYMSPEQLRGDGLDGRSDLYSLGVMLYEMLAGKLPFSSPTAVGFVTAHLHEQPPPLPTQVPRALAEVVMILLAKHAHERPANAAAVVSELRAALGGRSPAARKRARRRAARQGLVAVAVLIAVAGLGFGGWRLWQWRVDTAEALAHERARAEQLERKVAETEAAAAAAREQARAAAAEFRRSSSEVREQREQVQSAKVRKPKPLDEQTRSLLTRTRAQLEADLREVFEERRIPPSEAEAVWKTHEARVAAVTAGELEETELREQLVSLIALYRKSFEPKRRGERLSLDRLEQLFSTMRTKTELDEEQRRALLEAVYDEVDGDAALPEIDRDYYKRLAVAALIREHAADEDATSPLDDGPTPKPKPAKKPDGDQPPAPDQSSLPPADEAAPLPAPPPPLPSVDGI